MALTTNEWIGGVATTKWSETTNWSLGVVPTSAHKVVFKALLGGTNKCEVGSLAATCGALDCTGYEGTFSFGVGTLKIAGGDETALKLVSGMGYTPGTGPQFAMNGTGEATEKVWSGGKTIKVVFNGTGGKWQLEEAIKYSALEVKKGELKTNGQTLEAAEGASFTTAGTATRAVNFGASKLIFGTAGSPVLNMGESTGLTQTSSSAVIEVSAGALTFTAGGTWAELKMSGTAGVTVEETCTVTTLTHNTSGEANALKIKLVKTLTISTFATTAKSGSLAFIEGSGGVGKIKKSGASVNTNFLHIVKMEAVEGAKWYVGTGSELGAETTNFKAEAEPGATGNPMAMLV